jgi:amino acid transporter
MVAVSTDEEFVEHTTTLALEEKSKLVKSLRRFDMVFFTVCALVGLDTLGTVASNGPQGFLWLVVLAAVFGLPYALVMAEVGAAFTQEGGPYEWTKLAFSRTRLPIAARTCSGTGPAARRRRPRSRPMRTPVLPTVTSTGWFCCPGRSWRGQA